LRAASVAHRLSPIASIRRAQQIAGFVVNGDALTITPITLRFDLVTARCNSLIVSGEIPAFSM